MTAAYISAMFRITTPVWIVLLCWIALCANGATTFHLDDAPYEDYFYSDSSSASQVVVTSPLPNSNLSLIGPRLLIGWPAGNSGTVAFFAPKSGKNGTLSLSLVELSHGNGYLKPIFDNTSALTHSHPQVGVSGIIQLNSTAKLILSILGSIRTIRDFTEGPSILVPEIQDANQYSLTQEGVAQIQRLWLDNVTTSRLSFEPISSSSGAITMNRRAFSFKPGQYVFNASFDYPQLNQLSASNDLNPASQDLIKQQPVHTKSVSFLSYSEKLLAGGWRFLTYFGRDTMISLLLMQPVLSEGQGGAIEAVLGAVLERINNTDGSVCHEETIGDYATYLNMLNYNISSTKPSCSYIMIDTDYYFPIVMKNYFLDTATGRSRRETFFARKATLEFGNRGLSYAVLAVKNAERIVHHAAAFVKSGGQQREHLRHLEPGQIVGQWRDSTYGIGGGRIPFDVNTGLVPAALRAISALAAAGFYPSHPDWSTRTAHYAQIWEDHTLKFFEIELSASTARDRVETYVQRSSFSGPSHVDHISQDQKLTYHALALHGNDKQFKVEVMHTDVCFRLFLLNTTHQGQLTALLNQTATQIRQPFPIGLSTDVGMLIANPAYGKSPVYAANWTTAAYHGTVIWSWPLAMMGAGLGRQLGRCEASGGDKPNFCADKNVYDNVRAAYNHLWDLIDRNRAVLTNEVWSWTYEMNKFVFTPLGAFSPTESDAVQLWSLTFLAVTRDEKLR